MTSFDMTESIAPRSDQLNAEDMLTGPRTVTITEVRRGSAEQPVEVVTAEFGTARPFKPSKTVRRIMVAAWGPDAATYVGKRMTLYRDPTVRFGGADVGGIRVSAMSGIEKRLTLALTVTRGKRAPYVVEPLPEAFPVRPTTEAAPADDKLKALDAGLTALGITDKATKLATVAQVIDREIGSARELTPAEVAAVLDWIAHEQSTGAAAEPVEPTLPDGA